MFGVAVIVVPVALLVVIVLVAVAVTALGGRGRDVGPDLVTRESVLVGLTRVAGALVGFLAAVAVGRSGSYGVGVMLAPAAFGLAVLVATAIGETVVRPQRTTGVRSASLTPRRVADYLPRTLSRWLAVASVSGLLVVVLTTATASADEVLGGMRQIACQARNIAESRGPYPGAYYTVPLVSVWVVVAAVAALAARQVVRRPRGLIEGDAADDSLRRRSLEVVVAAAGVALCAPLAGVALVAGGALRGMATARPNCAATWMSPVGIVLLLAALGYLVLGLVCVARLLGGTARPVRAPVADRVVR